MSEFEIAVIGSGLSGIAFGRFYLDIHPQCQLAILEEDACVGGVWSSSRSYDEFWAQSGRRMAGFSDIPFTLPSDAPTYHDTFEAKYVTKYLEDYVNNHVYNGMSLRRRILFGHRVQRIKKAEGIWTIYTEVSGNVQPVIKSSKLVVATGNTSIPNMPALPNQKDFAGPILHHKQFGGASRSVLNAPNYRHIAVLGGGKSATDMVYESIKKGKSVSWIIRKSGEGPTLFFPAAGKGRYRNSTERGATRLKACLSPSSFMPDFWLPRFIHRSGTGRNYLNKMVKATDQSGRDAAAYQTREGALPGFRDLEYTTSAFWYTGPLGLVQHDDFWDTIAKNAHVYRKDISSMKPHTIVLDDGSEVPADALLCGTGWKFHYPFFSKEQVCSLGLPHSPEEDSAQEKKTWTSLLEAADRQVLARFPQLEYPPLYRKTDVSTTTTRLYNCIAPLEDRSVAFLGHAHLSNSFRAAEAQAIWTTAYLDESISLPPLEQTQREVAYMNAFSKRRYPSHGVAGDFLFFELVWYTDKLLRDVGLRSHRKRWWSDWMDPCLASDLKGAKDEYRKKYGF